MNELLPIIEQLANARSHAERAAWLRSCPLTYLGRYESTIRNRLMIAGFIAGLSYIDDMRVQMNATRDPDTGMLRPETQEAIAALGAVLTDIAEQLDAERARPAPDHSLTEL